MTLWNQPQALNALAAAVLLAALGLGALAGVAWVAQQPAFDIKVIRIEPIDLHAGRALRHINGATMRATALPRLVHRTSRNFFLVDLSVVRQAFESVEWVRRVQVRREWPNRLVVRIEEHAALGTWDEDQLLNSMGELFTANLGEAEVYGDLPSFRGPPGSEREVVARYYDFRQWFEALAMPPRNVTLSPRYAWTVQLNDGSEEGLTIEFGRERDPEMLAERAARLTSAYPHLTARWPHLRRVDLRYPNGFALRAEGLELADDEKMLEERMRRMRRSGQRSVAAERPDAKSGAIFNSTRRTPNPSSSVQKSSANSTRVIQQ